MEDPFIHYANIRAPNAESLLFALVHFLFAGEQTKGLGLFIDINGISFDQARSWSWLKLSCLLLKKSTILSLFRFLKRYFYYDLVVRFFGMNHPISDTALGQILHSFF